MAVVKDFRTAADYWSGMVEPDYNDSIDDPADLRAAFHSAISLFSAGRCTHWLKVKNPEHPAYRRVQDQF